MVFSVCDVADGNVPTGLQQKQLGKLTAGHREKENVMALSEVLIDRHGEGTGNVGGY